MKSPAPVRAGPRTASPPVGRGETGLNGDPASPARGRGRPRVVSGPGEGESDIPTAYFRLSPHGKVGSPALKSMAGHAWLIIQHFVVQCKFSIGTFRYGFSRRELITCQQQLEMNFFIRSRDESWCRISSSQFFQSTRTRSTAGNCRINAATVFR